MWSFLVCPAEKEFSHPNILVVLGFVGDMLLSQQLCPVELPFHCVICDVADLEGSSDFFVFDTVLFHLADFDAQDPPCVSVVEH